ncbi:hypothetical protein AUJ29_00680 [Candidatus Kuenenbacteria bacterium CG1_02_38_13]|uniref:Uncharacterized protein n=1 Tax=Candidatus Kuenenbacteria bacterium CG1_02_38_13 TaxID=1805235 RepID=A0A1J4U556_9BACT|nr:MAG: hypothetical protein AUJ29_00680 [Candidatus Kuenenbacteria bacterium CG1_02_38_13]
MLWHFLIKVIYFYIISFFLAVLEIQIEGPHGWAAKLPAWRLASGSKIDKLFRKISGQKELTGYHTALMIFLLLVFHLVFIWDWQWDIFAELELLSMFFLFTAVWDFSWFVLNPLFSLHDFGPNKVWWHKKWLGPAPVDYYFEVFASIALLLPEVLLNNWQDGIYKIAILLGVNLFLTAITVRIYPRAY